MAVVKTRSSIADARAELAALAAAHNLPVDRLEDAFRGPGGRLVESDEFRRWSMLRLSTERAAQMAAARAPRPVPTWRDLRRDLAARLRRDVHSLVPGWRT